jgi:hypothetical protein
MYHTILPTINTQSLPIDLKSTSDQKLLITTIPVYTRAIWKLERGMYI